MIREAGSVSYVRQQEPAGLGHAVWCARKLVHDQPVAVLLADDLILGKSCLAEMVEHYQGGNMVAVMDIPANETKSYGIVTPGLDDGRIVEVKGLVEKPDPEQAPSNIAVVGRYIIDPAVFVTLDAKERGAGNEIQLTDALAKQIGHGKFAGLRFSGERFDCGSKLGFLQANLAFAMENDALAPALEAWIRGRIK
jgi:UTP--glucose-1-phosphate uridylyltransferase